MKGLLLFFILTFQLLQVTKSNSIDSESVVCDKAEFDKRRDDKTRRITEDYLGKLKTSCTKMGWNKTCNSFPTPKSPSWSFRFDQKSNQEYLQFNLRGVNNTGNCWIFAFVEISLPPQPKDGEKETEEIYFYEINQGDMDIQRSYKAAFNYTFKIIPLPTGDPMILNNWKAPSRCENEVISDVQINMRRDGVYNICKNQLNYQNLHKEAKELCNNFTNKDERRDHVKNVLKVNKNCMIVYVDHSTEQKSTNSATVTIISAIVVPLGFAVIIIYIIYKRRKKRHFTDDLEVEEHNKNQNGPSSVMIVHRPGCDYLDKLVYQLSSFLMSYNLDVKVTFNDEDLSAHGGIASYLHRNIETCDYVIIFITEKSGKNPLLKHRPYEFSLKLMEGLAVHETSTKAHFIPVYLTNYKQAVTIFPPFLKATSGYGYCIPQQNAELVQKLFKGRKQLKTTNDRQVKDKLFRSEMKETVQHFTSFLHRECNKEHCKKGVKHGSHTNLSSIWATTVNTKWKSNESLNEDENIINEEEENEMKEIQFHKTLDFVRNLSDTNSEVGQYDTLTTDNPDSYSTENCYSDGTYVHYSSQSSDEVMCNMDKEHLLKVKNT